jgi:mono/diheme cytochrome c family protein
MTENAPETRKGAPILRALLVLIVLVVVGGGGFAAYVWQWSERPAKVRGRQLDVKATPELVARGRYLSAVSCEPCHGADLGGGREFVLPTVRSWAANVTHDSATGIGSWSAGQVEEAIRRGVRPDGRVLRAPMPLYETLSDDDVFALIAYLGTVTPVSKPSRQAELTLEGRLAIALGRTKPRHSVITGVKAPPVGATRDYGDYLANAVMRCADCHHPREKGLPVSGREWSGGEAFEEPGEPRVLASNITPDPVDGIGNWAPLDLARALRDGKTPSGRVLAKAMPRYPVTDDDAGALAAFLRGVPSVKAHVYSAQALRGSELYFAKGCISCHGPDGKGPRGDFTKAGREGDLAKIASWIKDPSSVKPGTEMPRLGIEDPGELEALARFVVELSKH